MSKFKVEKTNYTDEDRLYFLETYLIEHVDDMCDLEIYKREQRIKNLRRKLKARR